VEFTGKRRGQVETKVVHVHLRQPMVQGTDSIFNTCGLRTFKVFPVPV
jgi:hypothetical protein